MHPGLLNNASLQRRGAWREEFSTAKSQHSKLHFLSQSKDKNPGLGQADSGEFGC